MRREEIEQALDALGSAPVTPPDEAAIARIETRWRAAAAGTPLLDRHPVAGSAVPARRRSLVFAGAGLVAAAAVAAALLVMDLGSSDPAEVVVADAEDIVIVMPNGQFTDPKPGETLPNGAFVQAGPYAAGRIGGSDVHPDDLFIVVDGHLKTADVAQLMGAAPESSLVTSSMPPDDSPSVTARTSDTPVTTRSEPVTIVAEPSKSESAPTTLTPTDPTPPVPAPAEVSQPDAADLPEVEVRAPAPPAQPAQPAQPAVAAEPTPAPASIRVTARLDGDKVVLNWKSYSGDAFRRYVVSRVRSWDGSRPSSGRIGIITDRKASKLVDHDPKAETQYVVVVVGADQQTLAIGAVDSPFPGRAGGGETPIIVQDPENSQAPSPEGIVTADADDPATTG